MVDELESNWSAPGVRAGLQRSPIVPTVTDNQSDMADSDMYTCIPWIFLESTPHIAAQYSVRENAW